MAKSHKARSIKRLSNALNRIPALKQASQTSPSFEKWRRDTVVAIQNVFENRPDYVKTFENIRYTSMVISWASTQSDDRPYYVLGLDRAASMLESMIDEIKEYWDDAEQAGTGNTVPLVTEVTNQVFVVHGSDDGTKETVARFLDKLGLQPVILHEQANQGRTIIEKFEEFAQVGFAVVLLTPDDIFSPSDQSVKPRFRPRQNVILELGYFLGKLGRHRTLALQKGNLELPSDYDGVLYVPLDDQEAWRMHLVRELKEAGFDVDANMAL